MDEMDWKAAINSEVFREYVKNELSIPPKKEELNVEAELKIIEDFSKFQNEVLTSPKKVKVFKALQEKFATDSEYTSKVDKSFVDAVMLLDLGE